MRPAWLVPGVLAALGTAAALAAPAPVASPGAGELVGARLVVAIRGTTASAPLRARVRRGEVAGVILFRRNVESAPQVRALTSSLQAEAAAGGRAPLLVCVDQEGGDVRRLPWLGPVAAEQLGRRDPVSVRREGRATGRALMRLGVNCDLAPVADVPVGESFLGSRAFGRSPVRVAESAAAFARGLADAGVLAAAKHFPGIGRASANTDRAAVRIDGSRAALERDLGPFRALIAAGVPLVMLANASYAAFGPKPAGWAPEVANGLLRRELGFAGVTITDSLDGPAAVRGWRTPRTALLAAQAGIDLLLVTGSEATGEGVYRTLVRAAREGRLPRAGLQRSAARVAVLRGRLPGSG